MSVLIDGFEIDATLAEDHAFDSEVTEHPVEIGADITDHVRARPIEVTIQGLVSDTPIGALAERRGFDGVSEPAALPSDVAFSNLLGIRDAREPVTITTSLKTFENMVLESLSVPRSARTGHALEFTARFRQVELVTNQRTTVPTAVPRAASKRNLGHKASADPTSAEAKKTASAPPKPEQSRLSEGRRQELQVARNGEALRTGRADPPPQSKLAPPSERTANLGRQLLGGR